MMKRKSMHLDRYSITNNSLRLKIKFWIELSDESCMQLKDLECTIKSFLSI